MSDFSIYTKEEQLEKVIEQAMDYEDLHNHIDNILNTLKHNLIKCLEKAFESTIQGKKIEFTTDSKLIIKK